MKRKERRPFQKNRQPNESRSKNSFLKISLKEERESGSERKKLKSNEIVCARLNEAEGMRFLFLVGALCERRPSEE